MEKTGDHNSGTTKQASVKVKPPTYQPSAQELNQEFDMPGASMETVRRAFFNTVDTADSTSGNAQDSKSG